MQKGFYLELNKCTGCEACVLACRIENDLGELPPWRVVHIFNPEGYPGTPRFFLSLACNHCVEPDCMKGCPARAFSKDPATGGVLLDRELCIGCRYCTWICPYDAAKYSASEGTAHKCTFCNDRQIAGNLPACVTCCPTGALRLTEFEGSLTPVPGFSSSPMLPAITFSGSPVEWTPGMEIQLPEDSPRRKPPSQSKISARGEASLVVFTLLVTLVVAWQAAFLAGSAPVPPLVAVLTGAVAILVSLSHLGSRSRSFRAVLTWRSSWVSREVFFLGAFLATMTVGTCMGDPGPSTASQVVGLATLALGTATLFSIDRIYSVLPLDRKPFLHSAQTLLTAPYFAAIFTGTSGAALTVAVLKGVTYVCRKLRRQPAGSRNLIFISLSRLLLGVVLPGILWYAGYGRGWILASALLGETIDRLEFYEELDVRTPASGIHRATQYVRARTHQESVDRSTGTGLTVIETL